MNMKVRVEKMWKDSISIRTPTVNRALKQGIGIEVHYGTKVMTIPPKRLTEGKVNTKLFRSNFNGSSYTLTDFKWIPDEETNLKECQEVSLGRV